MTETNSTQPNSVAHSLNSGQQIGVADQLKMQQHQSRKKKPSSNFFRQAAGREYKIGKEWENKGGARGKASDFYEQTGRMMSRDYENENPDAERERNLKTMNYANRTLDMPQSGFNAAAANEIPDEQEEGATDILNPEIEEGEEEESISDQLKAAKAQAKKEQAASAQTEVVKKVGKQASSKLVWMGFSSLIATFGLTLIPLNLLAIYSLTSGAKKKGIVFPLWAWGLLLVCDAIVGLCLLVIFIVIYGIVTSIAGKAALSL